AWRSDAGARRTGEAIFPSDGTRAEGSPGDATSASEAVAWTAGTGRRQGMTSTQPPRIATWLLRHFGSSPRNESLIGDLNERYRQGRPRSWYWRQSLSAIAVGLFRGVRQQKVRTLAAVVTGCMIFAFYRSPLDRPLFQSISLQINFASMQFQIPPSWWIYYGMYVLLLSFLTAIMGLIVGAFSGWIIAKFQPSHRVPIVLMFVACLC